MNKQDTVKKAEAAKVTPLHVLMGQVFYRSQASGERDINALSVTEFDALALSFGAEIVNVKRDVWDAFARAKFLTWLLAEGDIRLVREGEKLVLAEVPAEEKTSAPDMGLSA